MDVSDFYSVPDDLLSAALTYGRKLEADGHKLQVEPYNISYPRTPIFVARRKPTTVILEVHSSLRWPEIREWARYGQTCTVDTRFIVGLLKDAMVTADEMGQLKELRVGLWMISDNGPFEAIPPHDLALNVQLPSLPPGLVRLLGAAYDQFDRGQWREGFEEACQVLEQSARSYLKLHMSRGRVAPAYGNGKAVSAEAVGKMPLGPLADAFAGIAKPNAADTRITQALKTINRERVLVAHYKGKREAPLRRKVRSHMFVIVGALRQIKGIKN